MQKFNRLFTRRNAFLLVVLVVSVALLMAIRSSQASTPADFFSCTPTGVATFIERVHVRCSPADPNGITYFAVCTANDSANASRFLSVFTTAKVTGKNIGIYYTLADTSGTSCGCSTADCRAIWGAEVLP
jgi:hypothetical protein